jgi:hypothetical protein
MIPCPEHDVKLLILFEKTKIWKHTQRRYLEDTRKILQNSNEYNAPRHFRLSFDLVAVPHRPGGRHPGALSGTCIPPRLPRRPTGGSSRTDSHGCSCQSVSLQQLSFGSPSPLFWRARAEATLLRQSVQLERSRPRATPEHARTKRKNGQDRERPKERTEHASTQFSKGRADTGSSRGQHARRRLRSTPAGDS